MSLISPPAPQPVLVIDYNLDRRLLSGHSLLAQIDNTDPERYRFIVVLNRSTELLYELEKRNIDVHTIPFGGGRLLRKTTDYGLAVLRIGRLIRNYRVRIVHANNVMAGRIAIACRGLLPILCLVHIRNCDIPAQVRPFINRADCFAPVSDYTLRSALPKHLHGRARVVYDGVETTDFAPRPNDKLVIRRRLGLPEDVTIVGMAGRLSPQKGQKFFIDAAKGIVERSPSVLFVHAGGIPTDHGGPYERELAAAACELVRSRRFVWLPYLDNLAPFWAACDIAVLPSSGPEALGRVVLEAMATGLPVVASMCGGPEEVIRSGETGFLVPPADTGALQNSIQVLVKSATLRNAIGYAALETVRQGFTAQRYAARLSSLYDSISS